MGVYDTPRYYDLAFAFRELQHEVDVMERCVREYSGRPVKRVLELACGHGPHAGEWARRGYGYTGLDFSAEMIAYGRERAAEWDSACAWVVGDMVRFDLAEPVDFAYVMLGSLYARSRGELETHFDSVAGALGAGGLYLLDWVVDFDPLCDVVETWEEDREGVHIRATVMTSALNRVEQTVEEYVLLEVTEGGTTFTLEQRTPKRAIYPQEFLLFLEQRPDFEFVGWWNRWDLDEPVDGVTPTNRPIVAVRRV